MNRVDIEKKLARTHASNPGLQIHGPGSFSPEETSGHVIKLLQAMYVQHALSNNKAQLIEAITLGNVLPWFASMGGEVVATASLVKLPEQNAWEIGRCVALDRGKGIGTAAIAQAVLHHLNNHGQEALVAEVRAPGEFESIPSGEATQRIFISEMMGLVPHAIAPLFAHGKPERNEPFILAASDVEPSGTISGRIAGALNGRSTDGDVPNLRVIQESPFRLIVPDNQGGMAADVTAERKPGCTLLPIEVTDANIPLIGMLSATPGMVACGVDRLPGKEGKPVVMMASFFPGSNNERLLAPAKISEVLPRPIREDLKQIANRFSQ